jgi:hypothetical protein
MRTTAIAAGGRPEESAKIVSRDDVMLHFVTVSDDGAIRRTTAPLSCPRRDASYLFRCTNDVNGQDKHGDETLREFVITSVMKTKHRLELKKPG